VQRWSTKDGQGNGGGWGGGQWGGAHVVARATVNEFDRRHFALWVLTGRAVSEMHMRVCVCVCVCARARACVCMQGGRLARGAMRIHSDLRSQPHPHIPPAPRGMPTTCGDVYRLHLPRRAFDPTMHHAPPRPRSTRWAPPTPACLHGGACCVQQSRVGRAGVRNLCFHPLDRR